MGTFAPHATGGIFVSLLLWTLSCARLVVSSNTLLAGTDLLSTNNPHSLGLPLLLATKKSLGPRGT